MTFSLLYRYLYSLLSSRRLHFLNCMLRCFILYNLAVFTSAFVGWQRMLTYMWENWNLNCTVVTFLPFHLHCSTVLQFVCKYKVISFDFRSLSHNLMPIFIDDCCELVVVYELLLVVSGLLLLLVVKCLVVGFLDRAPCIYIYNW